MSILVDKNARVLIQGITGGEGSRACSEILRYGTKVVAGVTPGKGGQKVEGVPVYNSVAEATAKHRGITASLIVVPAPYVRDAALEAMHAGIPLLVILTEHVPTQDSVLMVRWGRIFGSRIIGPSSVGVISPGKGKIGSIGSSQVADVFTPGPVGVISKSGGMTSEIAVVLSRAGFGQSTALGIGGDTIIGSDFTDMLSLFADDAETRAVVLFGEVGGSYEEQVPEYIKKTKFKKPVVAVVAGWFTGQLLEGTTLGHAGAIVSRGRGSYTSKVAALRKAGVRVVDVLEEIPAILSKLL